VVSAGKDLILLLPLSQKMKNYFKIELLLAGLQYGHYRSNLVHFEAQKYIFYVKKALA
jgi:hypothetical protein